MTRSGHQRGLSAAAKCFALLLGTSAATCAAADWAREFAYSIRPILSDKCFQCHGPDNETRPTDLRLDTEAGIAEAFGGGLPRSEAWRRITSEDPDDQMPPPESHKAFTEPERRAVRDWAAAGAAWSPHWAFAAPKRVDPPGRRDRSPIDAFVHNRMKEVDLAPNPPATRETLIRRATFDLHGLPPTLEEIDEFVADDTPDAWERLIDRLLASPRYGERMAVKWLDGARYADTNGYQNDFQRTMWPWRDWVVRSFNANMPFDRFAVEQIAGDLLPGANEQQRLATAFNRNNRTVTEAGSIAEEWMVENVVDRAETTSAVFLGLTMGCARCHDHKFDPISQEEFFEFFAFFNSVDELGVYTETRGNVGPVVRCVGPTEEAEQARLAGLVEAADARVESLKAPAIDGVAAWLRDTRAPARPTPRVSVRLDSAPFSAIGQEEQTVEPGSASEPPEVDDSFLGPVAAFDGSRWLEYADLFLPEQDRPMTASAWVNRRGAGAVLSKMHDSASYRGIDLLFDDQGRLMVHLINSWPSAALKVTTKEASPSGDWSLVTVTYDGSAKAAGVKIFFGLQEQELDVERDSLDGTLHTDQPLRIGRRSNSAAFNGSLAHVRLFDRALSVDEVRDQMLSDLLDAPAASEIAEASTCGSDRSNAHAAVDAELLIRYASFASDEASRRYTEASAEAAAARKEATDYEASIPTCMVMKELAEPRPTYVLRRGEYDKADKDRPVSPAIPDFLGDLPEEKHDRLALANWIVSRDNPLTARVVVNRLWGVFFGRAFVKSEENLGVQCDPPTHPDLLDWLAVELMDSGWDVQHVIRLIMTSDTYRQASEGTPEAFAADPENRWLARGPRRRLPAEFVRDSALAVSGLLTKKLGGPSAFPYQPEGLWEELAGGASQGPYTRSDGEDLYRRSLYTYRKRTVPHPTMSTFDAPSFEMCTVKRSTTNTPLQALALLNDVTYVEAARKLGERMIRSGDGPPERLRFGFRVVTSREPTESELTLLVHALSQQRARYDADPESAERLLEVGEAPADASFATTESAAYATVAGLLLNLDEAITVE